LRSKGAKGKGKNQATVICRARKVESARDCPAKRECRKEKGGEGVNERGCLRKKKHKKEKIRGGSPETA